MCVIAALRSIGGEPVIVQECEDSILRTWLLIKDRPDATQYASQSSGGNPYNYMFRKVLIRKFKEVRLFHGGTCSNAIIHA